MWKSFNPQEMAGRDNCIDITELARNFLNDTHCKEILLASPRDLGDFLKDEIPKKPGVYCIYDKMRKEVLDVGKSKNLNSRIREQLIGIKNRKTGRLNFPRLFFAVLKKDKKIKEKDYKDFTGSKKDELIKYFQDTIFKSNSVLRVCPTKSHLEAMVLEHVLIQFFKNKGQSRYNYQV